LEHGVFVVIHVGVRNPVASAGRDVPHQVSGVAHGINPYIHGLRGVLALMVYTYHIVRADLPTFSAVQSGPLRAVLDRCEWGVDLFFAVSGFVIMGALLRSPGAGMFLWERAIRIYPVLWPPLAVSLTWGLLFHHREFAITSVESVLWSIPGNLLALPGVVTMFLIHPPAWSLSYEVAFYVFCAAAWALQRRWGRDIAWLWAPAACLLVMVYPRAAFFGAGVVVALGLVERFALPRFLARFPLAMLALMLLCWGAVQTITGDVHIAWTTMFDWSGDARLPLALVAIAAGTLFIQGVVNGAGVAPRLLTGRIIQWFGTVSYSFYLWHIPALALTRRGILALGIDAWAGPASQLALWVLTMPLAMLLAFVSWRVIEVGLCRRLRAWSHVHGPSARVATGVSAAAMDGSAPSVPQPSAAMESVTGRVAAGLDRAATAATNAADQPVRADTAGTLGSPNASATA